MSRQGSPLQSRRNVSANAAVASDEKKLRDWLADKLPEHSKDLHSQQTIHAVLKTGVVLCALANHISHNVIPKVWNMNVPFKWVDNVNKFLTYLKLTGFPPVNTFGTGELVEATNITGVVQSLLHFKDYYEKHSKECVVSTQIGEETNVHVSSTGDSPSQEEKLKQKQKEQQSKPKPQWKIEQEKQQAEEDKRRREYLAQQEQQIKQKQQQQKTQQQSPKSPQSPQQGQTSSPGPNKIQNVKERMAAYNTSAQHIDVPTNNTETKSARAIGKAKEIDPAKEEERKAKESLRAASLQTLISKQNLADVEQARQLHEQMKIQEQDKKESRQRALEQQKLEGGPFVRAGQKPGIEIWRIEQFEAIKWPLDMYGKFHTGDAYILLHTVREKGPYTIYFWLGDKSSQDERGTAAFKTVELAEKLGGDTVQKREVQFHESNQFQSFLSDFTYSLEYVEGGISSGFHVNDKGTAKKLYCCKGKHNVRISPVPVHYESLNSGDVFVLDLGMVVWHWSGIHASRREQIAGLRMTRRLADSRGGKAAINVVDQGKEPDEFWISLGSAGPIKSANEVHSDEHYDKKANENVKLYLVSDSTGEPKITLKAKPPLKQNMLDSNDCFVLDIGDEMFAWFGHKCTAQEKKMVVYYAQDLLKNAGHPDFTSITSVNEDSEPPIFKEQFETWKDLPGYAKANHFVSEHELHKRIAERVQKEQERSKEKEIQLEKLITKKKVEDTDPFDKYMTLEGTLKIWRIENFEAVPLPESQWGTFYSGDSYIILFTPEWKKMKPVIYYWIGRNSTQDERGAAAVLTTEIAKGTATHIRVLPGKEPAHFLTHFKGHFVIKIGGVASGFKNVKETTKLNSGEGGSGDDSSYHLFHVQGTTSTNTRAMEIECQAENLNSCDTFVLTQINAKHSKNKSYLWFGNKCEPIEREIAKITAKYLTKKDDFVVIEEGKESNEFWTILGGKKDYAFSKSLKTETSAPKPPRLYHCWNAKGWFDMEEIYNFTQDDLLLEDIYILDVFNTVFVWVGTEANSEEKIKSMQTAVDYVERASKIDGRALDQPIIKVIAGEEPPIFTCWFHAWEPQKAGIDIFKQFSLEQQNKQAKAIHKSSTHSSNSDVRAEVRSIHEAQHAIHPYARIRMDVNKRNMPEHVDTKNLEKHLSDEDFDKLFKMSRNEFYNLPVWKQENVKSALHLY